MKHFRSMSRAWAMSYSVSMSMVMAPFSYLDSVALLLLIMAENCSMV